MSKQISPKIVSLAFGVMVVVFAVGSYIFAVWQEPGSAPPADNVLPPLNVSYVAQEKVGGLILNTGGATNGLIVDKGNVGIGTASPGAKLDISGNIKIADGTQGTDKVLTSDASGVARWKDPIPPGSLMGMWWQNHGTFINPFNCYGDFSCTNLLGPKLSSGVMVNVNGDSVITGTCSYYYNPSFGCMAGGAAQYAKCAAGLETFYYTLPIPSYQQTQYVCRKPI